jgi:hypothetical protein
MMKKRKKNMRMKRKKINQVVKSPIEENLNNCKFHRGKQNRNLSLHLQLSSLLEKRYLRKCLMTYLMVITC